MYSRIKTIKGTHEVNPVRDSDTLFVVAGSGVLVLPPVDRSGGVSFGVLPRGKSRVSLRTSDKSKTIDPGNGLVNACTISGQAIIDVVMSGEWVMTVGSSTLAVVPDDTPDDPGLSPSAQQDDAIEADESDDDGDPNDDDGE